MMVILCIETNFLLRMVVIIPASVTVVAVIATAMYVSQAKSQLLVQVTQQ